MVQLNLLDRVIIIITPIGLKIIIIIIIMIKVCNCILAKRSRIELTSKPVDLLQEDSSVFSELVSQAGASLHHNGSSVELCKLNTSFIAF